MKVAGELKIIEISKIKPNKWNPNVQTEFIFEKERNSIRENGFIDPILVREKGKLFEIIDGEHRFRAAKAEGLKKVSVNNLGIVDDATAEQLTIIMNETRGQADPQKMRDLMKSLSQKVSIDKLIQNLPRTEAEIEALVKEAEVDWDKIGPEIESSSKASETDPHQALKKTIELEVPEEVHDLFFDQIDRVNKILFPDEDPGDCEPIMALQTILQVLAQTNIEGMLEIKAEPPKNKKKSLKK